MAKHRPKPKQFMTAEQARKVFERFRQAKARELQERQATAREVAEQDRRREP